MSQTEESLPNTETFTSAQIQAAIWHASKEILEEQRAEVIERAQILLKSGWVPEKVKDEPAL